MISGAYIIVPAVLVGLAVPTVTVVAWRAGQRLASVIVSAVMSRAMDVDDNLVSTD